ncbi:MAG: hypothetical protein COW71_14895 [Ignavibacteriales bacterium CG18_big_fil_WC_8_21_14_2_50_31_20]|nr:MAG: hypothetical protein COW71_14895 [Ignavibacteriales bacterium CG18_big_fil_WC_8_21_14_2_50_31_20]
MALSLVFNKMKIKYLTYLIITLISDSIYSQFDEYTVKAQFMERFTHYIEWPEGSTIKNQEIPFRIGVYGENHFENKLNEIAELIEIKNKKVELREVDFKSILDCDMLFISKCSEEELNKIIRIAVGRSILLISDSDGFGKKGVHINFYNKNDKINFEINISSTRRDTFKISSRLLKLARIIE